MRTLAIINQKGGCGKTTTSINLAACLARLGHKTLLVDMDPQGHCGVGLAVPEDQIERTIYDALIEESDGRVAGVPEIVWQIASDFDLVPASIQLAAFEQVFAGRAGREDRLLRALKAVDDRYAWCVIDCPPSVGLLTFNALRACDEVIVPVETGYFSLHGLTKMMETLELMREQCGKEIEIHVLPTQYDTRTKLAREVLAELRNNFAEYLMQSTVNFNTKLKEAASFGQPITEYDPGSRGYKDFVNLARELMGHRPVEVAVAQPQALSRPAELVQRAKQLSQLSNVQFGRTTIPVPASSATALAEPPAGDTLTAGLEDRLSVTAEPPVVAPTDSMPVQAPAEPVASQPEEVEIAPVEILVQPSAEEEAAQEKKDQEIERKILDFYGVKQVGSELVFSARFENAQRVSIAGDFNNWSSEATAMERSPREGDWRMNMSIGKGRYRYRLVVDGKWVTDPNNQYVESNQFGELNNVVEVE